MNELPITLRSGELTLEGLLANRGGEAPAAVVCHPHPMYGGSMFNNVVDAILAAMWQLGYSTLRFNFRGAARVKVSMTVAWAKSMTRVRRWFTCSRNRACARTAR